MRSNSDKEIVAGHTEPCSSKMKGAEADDEGENDVVASKRQGRTPKKKVESKRKKIVPNHVLRSRPSLETGRMV